MGGAAHFRIAIAASLAGMSFGFGTSVIAGVTTALCEFFRSLPPVSERRPRCGMAHIARSIHRRRTRRSLRQPRHAARRRSALRDLCTASRSCVELHLVHRVDSSPASPPVHLRCAHRYFPVKPHPPSHLSRDDAAAIHRRFFLDAGNARRGTGTNERAAAHGRAKKSHAAICDAANDEHPVRAIKNKENI